MNHYKPESVAFLTGSLVMILELVGTRVLSPYFGSSIYIWTGMIGIILGFLSLGYYFGGKASDKHANHKNLSSLLWFTGLFVFFLAAFKEPILSFFVNITSGNIKSGSVLAISFLFGPASFLLGCVSPFLVKLKLTSLRDAGKEVGNIYVLSTLGSIFGTFLAGYVLIPKFGNTQLIYFVSIILITLSFWIRPAVNIFKIITMVFMAIIYYLCQYQNLFKISSLADIDTSYNRVIIKDILLKGKPARVLMTDKMGIQSALYLNDPNNLATDYTNAFLELSKNLPKAKNSLMIGGAGFVFPQYFVKNQIGESIDVVEIDPQMEQIAKKYFGLVTSERLRVFSADARNYIKQTEKKYDLIFLDAFSSIIPPFHLTTSEFFTDISKILCQDGTLVINLISSLTGPNSQFLSYQYSTLNQNFKHLDLFTIQKNRQSNSIQNLILVASNNSPNPEDNHSNMATSLKKVSTDHLLNKNHILTDNFAPVEHLTSQMILN